MSLPPELDFESDREASPARMNRAMLYLFLRLGAATALQPEFRTAIDQLNEVGLARLNEVLTPIFLEAQQTAIDLAAIKSDWLEGDALDSIVATLTAQVTAAIAGAAAANAAQIATSNAAIGAATAATAAANAALAALGNMSARQKAALADLFGWTGDKGLTTDLVGSAFAQVALAYNAALVWDWRDGFYRGPIVCLGNVTIGLPSNIRAGETRIITLKGNDATARTVSFNAAFKGALPQITDMTSTKPYRLVIFADSGTELTADARALA